MPRFSKTADQDRPLGKMEGDGNKKLTATRIGFSSDAIGDARHLAPEGPVGTSAASHMQTGAPKGSKGYSARMAKAQATVMAGNKPGSLYGKGYGKNNSRNVVLGVRPTRKVQ